MRVTTTLLLLIGFFQSQAQYVRNFANSNYGGVHSVSYNPANLADSRYRFVMTPISVFGDVSNNFINVRTPYSFYQVLNNNVPEDQLDENGIPVFDNSFIQDRMSGQSKQAFVSAEVTGPSLLFGFKDKSGFSFTTKTRVFASINKLNEDLLKIFVADFDTSAPGYSPKSHQEQYLNQQNVQTNFGAGGMAYQEFAFSYASILHDKKEHFVKGGASIKYLIGLAAAYVRVDELAYELVGEDSLRMTAATMNLAYTSDQYFSDPDRRLNDYLGKNKLGRGVGLDIGAVYEFRPNYKEYNYRMDRRKHEDRTVNKYKFKIGAAITDLGRIKFDNSPYTKNLDIISNGDTVDWADFEEVAKFAGTNDIDSFTVGLFPSTTIDNSFKAKLPASLNLNFDYNINDIWFANASYVQTLRGNKVRGVRKQNVLALGARYETRRFEASSNLIFGRFYNQVALSAFFRYGPVFIGSDNLGGVITAKSTNGINIYAGVQLPILHNRIPDKDGDGTSDEKDKCPDTFGSEYAKGCPDADDDRVPDFKDKCPTVPGARNAEGCPDEDLDGVSGIADKCPTEPGTAEHEGCPDTDGDDVPDHLDACIDEAGLTEYNGCPDPFIAENTDKTEETKEPVQEVTEKDPTDEKPKSWEPTESDPHPEVIKKEVVKEKPRVEPKPVITPSDNLTVDDVANIMDYANYDFYLILGAYKNKVLADDLVKKLNRQAGVLTYIYYDETNQMNYVTFGRVTNKPRALEQLAKLKKPSVDRLINGHVWWKKVPK